MEKQYKSKNLSDSFLYRKYDDYEKKIFEAVMVSDRVEKNEEGFSDIKFEVKRYQISNSLVKLLDMPQVVLILPPKPMPRSLKVFTVKDVKTDGKMKVFIDCSNVIIMSKGRYICANLAELAAYLVNAMNSLIYYSDTTRIVMNNDIIKSGMYCFSSLFTNIVNSLYRINSIESVKSRCLYLSSIYFAASVLNKDPENEGVNNIAKNISGLSDREQNVLNINIKDNTYNNIKYFVQDLSSILKLDKLTADSIVEKWAFMYGPGTVFGLELYPSFASMITDAYVGGYINNQKTIEKTTGAHMPNLSKAILKIGEDSI